MKTAVNHFVAATRHLDFDGSLVYGKLHTRLIMHIIPENVDQNVYWNVNRSSVAIEIQATLFVYGNASASLDLQPPEFNNILICRFSSNVIRKEDINIDY